MPRATSSEEEGLPSPGDPDRKRVLNVLAQRRYRQRRRQRIAELEARAQGPISPATTSESDTPSKSDQDNASPPSLGGVSIAEAGSMVPSFDMSFEPGPSHGEFDQLPDGFGDVTLMDDPLQWSNLDADALNELPALDQESAIVPDPVVELGLPNSHNNSIQQWASSTSLSLHAPEIPLYKVMSFSLTAAGMLGCLDLVWDPKSRWTVDPLTCAGLPQTMQPTPAQMSIPHHPLLDLVPFASVRTKLICFFAMPPEFRPPHARAETALIDVVHDMEDPADGFRISGEDGFREEDWEVGEAFAKNYWWALDREIIRRTNEWRVRRGARRLLEIG